MFCRERSDVLNDPTEYKGKEGSSDSESDNEGKDSYKTLGRFVPVEWNERGKTLTRPKGSTACKGPSLVTSDGFLRVTFFILTYFAHSKFLHSQTSPSGPQLNMQYILKGPAIDKSNKDNVKLSPLTLLSSWGKKFNNDFFSQYRSKYFWGHGTLYIPVCQLINSYKPAFRLCSGVQGEGEGHRRRDVYGRGGQ